MHKVNDKDRGRKRSIFKMCRSVEKSKDGSYQKMVGKSSNLQTTLSRSYEFAQNSNTVNGKDHMVRKVMKMEEVHHSSGASTSSVDTVDRAIRIPYPIDYPDLKITKVFRFVDDLFGTLNREK